MDLDLTEEQVPLRDASARFIEDACPLGTLPVRARIGMEIGRAAALTWHAGDVAAMAPALDYLNGRVMSIAGGTNEVQRNAIGERVLGLPREPSFDTGRPFHEVVRNAQNWSGKIQ